MKICIDPGHSGPFEPGACAGGATEAEINLEVAKIAGRMLEKFGHKVLLTRTGDVDNNWLTWRCEAAWNFDADIFISIHCNACDDEQANGTEVFYFPTSENGHALACCIQSELVALCHTVDRKVKTNDEWTVLRETAMPAVLVELAFITNEAERAKLTSDMGQRQFAEGIVRGINRFADGGPLFGKVMESPASYDVRSA
jgi:N-acetylmuramoyl-L-alanine amidase